MFHFMHMPLFLCLSVDRHSDCFHFCSLWIMPLHTFVLESLCCPVFPVLLSVYIVGHYWTASVQFSRSVVSDSATPWAVARQASLFVTNSRSSLKFMSTELVMPSHHLILCPPLLLLPSIFPSIRVFQWVSSSHQVANYWSFSFSISPSNEYSGLISFRMDWLDLLAVQGTLKCLLQHHNSKASILWCSVFFMVQLSHPYVTAGKTVALTMWTFVSKGVSLPFNMLSMFVIAFLPRSKSLLAVVTIRSDFRA